MLSKIDATDYNTQWVATSGGTRTLEAPAYVTGRYYSAPYFATSTSAMTANNTRYLQFYVSETTTFDRIGIVTGASFVGSATIRLGIYNNGASIPSTVVLDAGTVNPTAASTVYQATISQSLSKGWYWLAFNTVTAATPQNQFTTISTTNASLYHLFGSPTVSGTQVFVQDTANVTSGFATATGTTYTGNATPLIALRKS